MTTELAIEPVTVIGGVDTHKHTHHASVVSCDGVLIASKGFSSSSAGLSELVGWLTGHGKVVAVGVEGTESPWV